MHQTISPKAPGSKHGLTYISNTDPAGNMSVCVEDDGESVILHNMKSEEESWRGSHDDLEMYWTEL